MRYFKGDIKEDTKEYIHVAFGLRLLGLLIFLYSFMLLDTSI